MSLGNSGKFATQSTMDRIYRNAQKAKAKKINPKTPSRGNQLI